MGNLELHDCLEVEAIVQLKLLSLLVLAQRPQNPTPKWWWMCSKCDSLVEGFNMNWTEFDKRLFLSVQNKVCCKSLCRYFDCTYDQYYVLEKTAKILSM